jgi:hypothetical protein
MNCVENLPVYAAIVVCATAAQTTGPFWTYLPHIARSANPIHHAHHLEQTDRVVSVRFTFFFVQILCMFFMGASVAMSAAE